MVDQEDKKAPAKKPAATKPKATVAAAQKAEKPVVKASAQPKAAKAAPSGATVTVTQTGSPIGRPEYQRQTLKGLGLNKIRRTRTLEDTPAIRGMIEAVKHLVRVGDAK